MVPALGRLDFSGDGAGVMAGCRLRTFPDAQSLNQIDKAYGLNLDPRQLPCMRIAFATNDERTAAHFPKPGHRHRAARTQFMRRPPVCPGSAT